MKFAKRLALAIGKNRLKTDEESLLPSEDEEGTQPIPGHAYINYSELKLVVEKVVGDGRGGASLRFEAALQSELDRVGEYSALYVMVWLQKIRMVDTTQLCITEKSGLKEVLFQPVVRVCQMGRRLAEAEGWKIHAEMGDKDNLLERNSPNNMLRAVVSLRELAKEAVDLDRYRRLCLTGFTKIIKKFDKKRRKLLFGANYSQLPFLQAQRRLHSARFLEGNFDWLFMLLDRKWREVVGGSPPKVETCSGEWTTIGAVSSGMRSFLIAALLERFQICSNSHESEAVRLEQNFVSLDGDRHSSSPLLLTGNSKESSSSVLEFWVFDGSNTQIIFEPELSYIIGDNDNSALLGDTKLRSFDGGNEFPNSLTLAELVSKAQEVAVCQYEKTRLRSRLGAQAYELELREAVQMGWVAMSKEGQKGEISFNWRGLVREMWVVGRTHDKNVAEIETWLRDQVLSKVGLSALGPPGLSAYYPGGHSPMTPHQNSSTINEEDASLYSMPILFKRADELFSVDNVQCGVIEKINENKSTEKGLSSINKDGFLKKRAPLAECVKSKNELIIRRTHSIFNKKKSIKYTEADLGRVAPRLKAIQEERRSTGVLKYKKKGRRTPPPRKSPRNNSDPFLAFETDERSTSYNSKGGPYNLNYLGTVPGTGRSASRTRGDVFVAKVKPVNLNDELSKKEEQSNNFFAHLSPKSSVVSSKGLSPGNSPGDKSGASSPKSPNQDLKELTPFGFSPPFTPKERSFKEKVVKPKNISSKSAIQPESEPGSASSMDLKYGSTVKVEEEGLQERSGLRNLEKVTDEGLRREERKKQIRKRMQAKERKKENWIWTKDTDFWVVNRKRNALDVLYVEPPSPSTKVASKDEVVASISSEGDLDGVEELSSSGTAVGVVVDSPKKEEPEKDQPLLESAILVEPKGYLASERTFLQWVESSLMLFSASYMLLRKQAKTEEEVINQMVITVKPPSFEEKNIITRWIGVEFLCERGTAAQISLFLSLLGIWVGYYLFLRRVRCFKRNELLVKYFANYAAGGVFLLGFGFLFLGLF